MTTLNTTTLAQVQLNQVIEHLSELNNDDTIDVYNDYADDISCERIYHNDEMTLNEVFDSPYDAINRTNNFLYKDNQDYFTFNGYAHAISFDYVTDDNCPIDIEELAQWIVNNELFNDYDIEVTTLEDMLASIEDNINDIDSVDNIVRLLDWLCIDYITIDEWLNINDDTNTSNYIMNYQGLVASNYIDDNDVDSIIALYNYFNE